MGTVNIPFKIKRLIGGQWVRYTPLPPDETSHKLVRIDHHLGGYPQVLMLAFGYGGGLGGAGEGPAGGTDLVECPRHPVYHSPNALTVYTTGEIAALGVPQLSKLNDYEYLVTFDGQSPDSLYIKLLLNMGSADVVGETPVQLTIRQVE